MLFFISGTFLVFCIEKYALGALNTNYVALRPPDQSELQIFFGLAPNHVKPFFKSRPNVIM